MANEESSADDDVARRAASIRRAAARSASSRRASARIAAAALAAGSSGSRSTVPAASISNANVTKTINRRRTKVVTEWQNGPVAPWAPARIVALVALPLLALLLIATTVWAVPHIEQTLERQTVQRLNEAGYETSDLEVDFDYRTGTIVGATASAAELERVGIGGGIRQLSVAPSSPDDELTSADAEGSGTERSSTENAGAESAGAESAGDDETDAVDAEAVDAEAESAAVDLADAPAESAGDDEVAGGADDEVDLGTRLGALDPVLFPYAKSHVEGDAIAALDEAIEALRDFPDQSVEVVGHADSTGDRAPNQRLSERRAQAVTDYLVANGIDASRLTWSGQGEDDPIADNNTDEGRRLNRRAAFVLA
ncbi:MAG: outer membrane protein OmpA-like peptidoglycan-associated protein [Acidimicrobiales bacterium]|jgi:outer membrane protein OmpA-like peptidoglycan-associated protein